MEFRSCWSWSTHQKVQLTAFMLVPGMRVLGLVNETGFLESARVEDVFGESNDVLLTWLSGDNTGQNARLPISRLRVYAGHRVSINEEDELELARELETRKREQRLLCARERDAASMRVPDADSKRELVPLMIQMLDAKPLADDSFELIPERSVTCSDADLSVYSRKQTNASRPSRKRKPIPESSETETDDENEHAAGTLNDDSDGDYELPCSSGMFLGIHPDEARASDAQRTVDSPIAKAALARIFKSLIGQEDNLLIR